MTLTEMTAIIAARLGSRTGLDTQIQTEILVAQTKLESQDNLPWFRLTQWDTTAIIWTSATNVYDFPDDFLAPIEDRSAIHLKAPTSLAPYHLEPLKRVHYTDMTPGGVNPEFEYPATPLYYEIQSDRYIIWPIPDKDYYGVIFGYGADEVLDPGVVETNTWTKRAPLVLTAMAGLQMAKWLRDEAAANVFGGELVEANKQLWARDTMMKVNGFDMVMVD